MQNRAPNRAALASLLTACALAAQPQPTPEVAATYVVDGEVRQVSSTELALELGRRERHRPRGQEALQHLIDRTLVHEAAEREDVSPTRDEIRERVAMVRDALAAEGIELEAYLEEKQLSRRAFEREYIGLSIAQDKLVMKSVGLADASQVTLALRELWLEEARAKAGVVDAPDALSPGIVARVGGRQLTLADLGDVLAENASRETREHAIRQIVVRELLRAEAERRGFDASAADIEAELARRKQLIEADPTFNGVPYDELLKSQGTTLEELRRSPVIRAQVFREKLVADEFADADLDARIAADRGGVLAKHGARRHVHVILIRAADPPTEFVPLGFEQARARAEAAAKRIEDGMGFATAARIYSDEPASKVRGGDVGFHGRASASLPQPVLETAHALDPFVVSAPVRADDGWYLVRVTEVEEQPTDAVLRGRLREELGVDFVRGLVEAAQIRLADA